MTTILCRTGQGATAKAALWDLARQFDGLDVRQLIVQPESNAGMCFQVTGLAVIGHGAARLAKAEIAQRAQEQTNDPRLGSEPE